MEEIYRPVPEKGEDVEIYNHENTDMLGDMPDWLIHTGSYVVYGLLLLLIGAAFFIRYPDAVEKSVIVDDLASVEWITAPRDGMIDCFLVDDRSEVKRGDTLAVLQNGALLDDVKYFCQVLTRVEEYYRSGRAEYLENYPFNLIMGDMASAYAQFTEAVRTCLMYDRFDLYPQKQKFLKDEYDILLKTGKADELTQLKAKRELFELEINHRMELDKNRRMLELAYENMVNSLQLWEKRNIVRAGKDGVVVWGDTWGIGQRMTSGDTLCTVVSPHGGRPTGHIRLNEEEVAGITEGNRVNVEFNKYPAYSCGILIGHVASISFVPRDKNYAVEVEFPADMMTTAGLGIRCGIGLSGKAEIVTAERNVLSRIFAPVYDLFK